MLPPAFVGVLLNVQGTAIVALAVVAKAGMAGAPPVGVPLKGSQRTALLNQLEGFPEVCTGPRRSGRTVSEMPGPGPIDSVGFSGLPLCAWKKRPICQPET